MKSLQVARVSPESADRYTDLQVCKSCAGYFIGTLYTGPEGFTEPGSRDSGYFASAEDAAFALQVLERMHAELLRLRAKGDETGNLTDQEFSSDFSAVLVMCGLDDGDAGYRLEP